MHVEALWYISVGVGVVIINLMELYDICMLYMCNRLTTFVILIMKLSLCQISC